MALKWVFCVQVLLLTVAKDVNGYGGASGIPGWLYAKTSPVTASQVQQWLGDPALNKAASPDLCTQSGLFWCEAWHDGGALSKPREQALILPPCDTSCNGSGRVVPSELDLFFLPNVLRRNTPLDVPNLVNAVPPSKFLPDPIAKDLLFPILNDAPSRGNTILSDGEDDALARLLFRLGISPTSTMAQAMLSSLRVCVAANEDNKLNINTSSFCAPSLESMLDFSLSLTNASVFSLRVLSSDPISPSLATPTNNNASAQDASNHGNNVLTILHVGHGYNVSVVCHKLIFPFELHWCHQLPHTIIYDVILQLSSKVSMNNEKISFMHAISVCHLDTTTWPPHHPALRKLHLQPGKASSVCHWIPSDTPVWISTF